MTSRKKDESDDEDFVPSTKRFRTARSLKEERVVIEKAVPMSTKYKNSWAFNLFHEWKEARENKVAIFESTCFDVDLGKIDGLEKEIERMSAESLNFWIGKFIQEVADKKGEKYPAKTLYQLVAALKRYLEAKNRQDANFLNKNEPR